MLTREQLLREYRARRGTLASFLFVYGIIVGTMVLTAMAIT
ncbi:MAG: hypothetical protein AAFR35_07310 [Pseudomonadota bacterium]